uniref:Uncharacterized protein n=1 Tax=Arundo donax TaxID=35708 RepID=A0A0A9B4X1_ARUDO
MRIPDYCLMFYVIHSNFSYFNFYFISCPLNMY